MTETKEFGIICRKNASANKNVVGRDRLPLLL
jgi:hypothetical protein